MNFQSASPWNWRKDSDILNRFAALSHEEQERYIDGSREVESRQEMKNYVENMFRG